MGSNPPPEMNALSLEKPTTIGKYDKIQFRPSQIFLWLCPWFKSCSLGMEYRKNRILKNK